MENKITLRPEIVQQLIFSKLLLSQIRILTETEISVFSVAKKILVAHDAAEFGIAAIANQIGALPKKEKKYLMDYFEPIKEKYHRGHEVAEKEYCNQLNIVRNSLKHGMILPDRHQWMNVGDKVYSCLCGWCKEYLKISLDALDSSILINNPKVKELYDNAKKAFSSGHYQQVLELLAQAVYLLFEENSALRSLQIGIARAEDAIKLAAFGVHANHFLALQEFLPKVSKKSNEDILIQWKQEEFGHPGNWRKDPASFCMNVFLELTLKIQDADWIPGPIDFLAVYEHKIEAIKDNVEIYDKYLETGSPSSPTQKKIIKILKKGESVRGMVTIHRKTKTILGLLNQYQNDDKNSDEIYIYSKEFGKESCIAYAVLQDVRITCVPRKSNFVKEYFSDLPIIDMQLE